jgi:hypothetical protein
MGLISLKSSVFFSRFDGGVVFRGSEAPVVFRGKRAYDLVRIIFDRMEIGVTRAGLLAQLPEGVRPVAERLLGDLERHGLMRDRAQDDLHPEAALTPGLANLWNYLADHVARPGEAWARWQAQPFELEGEAAALSYALRALAETGARRIRLRSSVEAHEAICAAHPDLAITLCEAFEPSSSGPDAMRIHAGGDRPFVAGASAFSDAWYFGLLAGHLVTAYVPGRLQDALPSWEKGMRPFGQSGETGRLSPQRIALAAAAVAFAGFNRATGIVSEHDWGEPHVVEISGQMTPLPLPGSVRPAPGAVAAEAGIPSPAAAATAEIASDPALEAARILFDPVVGILEETDEDLAQVPLSAVVLRVRGEDRAATLGAAFGWGTTIGEARRRAIQRGVALYLRSLDRTAPYAATLAVEWSAEAGRAQSRAQAAAEGMRVAEPLPLRALSHPDTYKLAKLLGLFTGIEPAIAAWTAPDVPAARVSVALDGRVVAEACAPDLQEAAYVALGDACLAAQFGRLDEAAAAIAAAADAASPDRSSHPGEAVPVDLGFDEIAAWLHGSLVEARPQ